MTPLVYRTNGTWGTGKGSKLTNTEVDTNFYNLDIGKLDRYAMQGANLQFNGSAQFGSNAWSLTSQFIAGYDQSGTAGAFIGNSVALSAFGGQILAPQLTISGGVQVAFSYDISNAATAGTIRVQLTAWNSAGVYISDFVSNVVPVGPMTRYSFAGTVPAGTAYIRANLYFASPTTAPAYGVIFRRIKIEGGAAATPYSTETDASALGTMPFRISPIFQAVQALGKIQAVNGANLVLNGSGELGLIGWSNGNPAIPLTVVQDEGGTAFKFAPNGTAITQLATSDKFAVVGSKPYILQAEIYVDSAATGNFYVDTIYYDATNTQVLDGNNSVLPVAFNDQYQWVSVGDTPPATAVSATIRLVYSGATWTTLKFRRIKIEAGTGPSMYSQEASSGYVGKYTAETQIGVMTGNRNYIVDGAFERFITSPMTQTGTNTKQSATMYFIGAGTGGTHTLQSSSMAGGGDALGMTTPGKNWLSFNQTTASTGTVAANTAPFVTQFVENVDKFNKRSATFSMWLATASGVITIPTIIARQQFGTGGSPSAAVVVDKNVNWVVTTTPRLFSIRLDLPTTSGKTLGTNGDSSLQVGFWFPPGVTGQLYTAQWQLEASPANTSSDLNGFGGAPTPFEYRGEEAEEMRFLRYYRVVRVDYEAYQNGGQNAIIGYGFTPGMRAVPTTTLRDSGSSSNVGPVSIFSVDTANVSFSASVSANGTFFYVGYRFILDARL